jgi:hypothetical protein
MVRHSLLAVFVIVAPALGEAKLPLITPLRTGFGGFASGTSIEQITARRGPAVQDTALVIGRRLTYKDQVDGQTTTTYYFVHSVDGLDGGMFRVRFAPSACVELFERLSKEVSRANTELRPHDMKTGTQLCDGRHARGLSSA